MSKQTRIVKDDELTVGQLFLLAFRKWATFKGRASRYQYWPVILTITVIEKIIAGLYTFVECELPLKHWHHFLWFLPYLGFMLFLCIANASLMIRRLHDRNISGWLILAPIISAIIANVFLLFSAKPYMIITFCILTFVLMILLFLNLFFKGTKGPNKYGPDPKEGVEI